MNLYFIMSQPGPYSGNSVLGFTILKTFPDFPLKLSLPLFSVRLSYMSHFFCGLEIRSIFSFYMHGGYQLFDKFLK